MFDVSLQDSSRLSNFNPSVHDEPWRCPPQTSPKGLSPCETSNQSNDVQRTTPFRPEWRPTHRGQCFSCKAGLRCTRFSSSSGTLDVRMGHRNDRHLIAGGVRGRPKPFEPPELGLFQEARGGVGCGRYLQDMVNNQIIPSIAALPLILWAKQYCSMKASRSQLTTLTCQ